MLNTQIVFLRSKNNERRVTLAFYQQDATLFYSFATAHGGDTPNRKIGRQVAEGRLETRPRRFDVGTKPMLRRDAVMAICRHILSVDPSDLKAHLSVTRREPAVENYSTELLQCARRHLKFVKFKEENHNPQVPNSTEIESLPG